MALDLVIGNVRVAGRPRPVDIGIAAGRIATISPLIESEAPRQDGEGVLAFGGFVESHIHLDKACILDRCSICEGTLVEAVAETARAKAGFTVADVHARAARVLEKAILHGTNSLRTFVEIDPRAGFRSFEAISQLKKEYAFAIDLSICAFAQEGLTQEMQTYAMLQEALGAGASLVGGCPYTDPDPLRHIALIFDLAERFGTAVDFHLDFDLDPNGSLVPAVITETERRGFGGKVSIGHVTKLAAMPRSTVSEFGRHLADAGVALTVLPATDLFLTGRDADRLVPHGVAPADVVRKSGALTSIASNNILNPFTPYGDASLGRMANLFANVAQLSRDADLEAAFAMVSTDAARVLGQADYGIREGGPADIVLVDAQDEASAVREIAPAVAGWKRGVQTFARPRAHLMRP
jgi:cytosine deaminase